MNCQKIINLGLLSENESWTLFQKHADITDEFSKSLGGVPHELCNKCKGLPLAIVTVASSLKGKHKSEWDVALYKLRNSAEFDDHDEGVRDALSCLELSYTYLQNKEAELLFLMCSMFPEDYNISIEDLIIYAIGLGVGGRHPLKISRILIQVAIDKLVESCLLMPAEDMECVKMHDLVREVALWIAKRSEDRKILVNVDKPLNTLAGDDSIQNYFAVSSWWENENPIIGPLQAAKVQMLLLHINTSISQSSFVLSNLTFEGIDGLKVFSLTNDSYHDVLFFSLPPSVQFLTNVRTLRLNGLKLDDISFVAKLTMLEVLLLRRCKFNELPYEMGNLTRLKLLDLSGSDIFEKTYNGALRRCSQLEVFYFTGASADELVAEMVVDVAALSNLQCFSIHDFQLPRYFIKWTRSLCLHNFNICKLKESKGNILQKAESVAFQCLHGGCKNIIPDMVEVVGGMNDLTSLWLETCEEIECIFDITSNAKIDDLIPKFVELELIDMDNLTGLCQGPPLQVLCFFQKLEKLVIQRCIKIHITFPRECNLQNLKILILFSCKSGEVLFPTSVAQSLQKLEELRIRECRELKLIIAASGREHDGCNTREDIVPDQMNSHFLMPSLRRVMISDCPLLNTQSRIPSQFIGICPEYCLAKWPSHSLKALVVNDCPKLALSWIFVMIRSDHSQNENLPLKLDLELYDLPQLNSISWLGPTTPRQTQSLQCLKHLQVLRCENLKSLFSMEESRSLPELMSIEIGDCQELQHIVLANEELALLPNAEVYFPKLTDVVVGGCNKLKSLFPVSMRKMLPKLSSLEIRNSDQIEEVFKHDGGDRTIDEMEVILPNLTEIRLYCLPNFFDICQGYKLQAVKLGRLEIDECPKVSQSLNAIQVALEDGSS
ncbi:probable disease resistance protein At4g27220 [Medicago truncatula]|nr:probable disease resistance protein At4g27220 [Medicago truncatula]